MKSKAIKEERGITLVALVVTIVVLLILAGVSLNLVIGNEGILTRSKEAANKYAEQSENEQNKLNDINDWVEKQFGKESNTKESETGPYLPDDTFTIKEGTTDTGLVIQDSEGNEYVWVVVPRTKEVYKTTDLGKTTFTEADYASIEKDLKSYTSAYRKEPFYSDTWEEDYENEGWFTKEQYAKAKNNMLKSVYLNGGFYIGRYEAGIEERYRKEEEVGKNENEKYDITEEMPIPLSKADLYPYTCVTRTQAQKLAESINSGNKTSSLMFGIQWDLVLVFMEKDTAKIKDRTVLTSDSTEIGNYENNPWTITRKAAQYSDDYGETFDLCPNPFKKDSKSSILLTTGADSSFSVQNIYDMAGNVEEWTLETGREEKHVFCIPRGGALCYEGQTPISDRESGYTISYSYATGFRVAIF